MFNFKFGPRSLRELEGVHPSIAAVCHRALEITKQDFAVHDGLRTRDEQREMLASGASTTMDSKHLTGDAVDLVPYINGKLRWEWQPIFTVAAAVRQAAKEIGVKLRWGSAWDLNFTDTAEDPEIIQDQYAERFKERQKALPPEKRKKLFLDGPHFERILG